MVQFHDLTLTTREPVYQQIAAHVKRQIFRRTARNGDPIPSRREIAATLAVNPNTVQKAFRLMEDEGFIQTNGNAGSIIFVDDAVLHRIDEELTRGMVEQFVQDAKDNGLSFPRVISLIGELWEKD
ncbi:MAG: GntR family transcriptional regulator [Butyricicoccus sp.]|nr:GntR family transcriptional regulator [Butyricicoccus sp.]